MAKKIKSKEVHNLIQEVEGVVGKLYPAEIIDQSAYDEFRELESHPLLNERKFVDLSNGRKISLGTIDYRLQHIIKDLPDVERNKILFMRKTYVALLCKRNNKQRKAYGTYVDGSGNPAIGADGKFTHVKKEMVELFGRMFTAKEVHEIAVQQWNIPCTLHSIMQFRDRHTAEIVVKTEEHKRTYSDIRLGHKRSRLEELIWIYASRKRVYEISKKGDDHRLLLMTLEQIRKEIEGDSVRIDANMNINIESTINQHINRELFVNYPLKEIIMSRVAARLKVSPMKLLTEMDKSYYHGYLNPTTDEPVAMPAYPSLQTYDFDRIRRIQAQQEQTLEQEKKNVTVIPAKEIEAASSIKDMLLAKLANKSQNVNLVRNKLAGKFSDKSNKT